MTGLRDCELVTKIQLGLIKELYKNKIISDVEYSYVFNKYNKKIELFDKKNTDKVITIDIFL